MKHHKAITWGLVKINLPNCTFIYGVIPLAVKVMFFDTDGFQFRITDFDSFFVNRFVDGTANRQPLGRCRVTDQAHNGCQIV